MTIESSILQNNKKVAFTNLSVFTNPGGILIPNITLDLDLSRSGNSVTISAETNITANIIEAGFQLAPSFLPVWAEPIRKHTQFCGFSTGGSFFVAMNVLDNPGDPLNPAFFKREINTTISILSLGTINQVFSITYIAKN